MGIGSKITFFCLIYCIFQCLDPTRALMNSFSLKSDRFFRIAHSSGLFTYSKVVSDTIQSTQYDLQLQKFSVTSNNDIRNRTKKEGNAPQQTFPSPSIHKDVYATIDFTSLCGAACVVVRSPPPKEFEFSLNSTYHHETDDVDTEEVLYGNMKEHSNKSRWNKFLGGRIALRRALRFISADAPPILKNEYGAPTLPSHLTGSISHKDDLAVGVAKFDTIGRIGVDLEHTYNKAASTLWRRVLTTNEQSRLGRIPETSREEEVLLRFSLKEAIYKAIHPYLCRSIDFTEIEIDPLPDGSANINFCLKTKETFKYEVKWQKYRQKYWLTCVYVSDPVCSPREI